MAKNDTGQWQHPWQDLNQSLDRTDVAEWFSRDPINCASDPRGQQEIRSHDEGARPWYTNNRWQEAVKRQTISWWDDLKEEVRKKVGDDFADRFADYLAGYALVREFEQPKADQKQAGRVTSDWRQAKRFLQKNGFDIPRLHYPGGEHLRTSLITKMEHELATSPSRCKRQFCGHTISELWRLIGEVIGSESKPEIKDATVARISRRSRQRARYRTEKH